MKRIFFSTILVLIFSIHVYSQSEEKTEGYWQYKETIVAGDRSGKKEGSFKLNPKPMIERQYVRAKLLKYKLSENSFTIHYTENRLNENDWYKHCEENSSISWNHPDKIIPGDDINFKYELSSCNCEENDISISVDFTANFFREKGEPSASIKSIMSFSAKRGERKSDDITAPGIKDPTNPYGAIIVAGKGQYHGLSGVSYQDYKVYHVYEWIKGKPKGKGMLSFLSSEKDEDDIGYYEYIKTYTFPGAQNYKGPDGESTYILGEKESSAEYKGDGFYQKNTATWNIPEYIIPGRALKISTNITAELEGGGDAPPLPAGIRVDFAANVEKSLDGPVGKTDIKLIAYRCPPESGECKKSGNDYSGDMTYNDVLITEEYKGSPYAALLVTDVLVGQTVHLYQWKKGKAPAGTFIPQLTGKIGTGAAIGTAIGLAAIAMLPEIAVALSGLTGSSVSAAASTAASSVPPAEPGVPTEAETPAEAEDRRKRLQEENKNTEQRRKEIEEQQRKNREIERRERQSVLDAKADLDKSRKHLEEIRLKKKKFFAEMKQDELIENMEKSNAKLKKAEFAVTATETVKTASGIALAMASPTTTAAAVGGTLLAAGQEIAEGVGTVITELHKGVYHNAGTMMKSASRAIVSGTVSALWSTATDSVKFVKGAVSWFGGKLPEPSGIAKTAGKVINCAADITEEIISNETQNFWKNPIIKALKWDTSGWKTPFD